MTMMMMMGMITVAKSLPKGSVNSVIGRMKGNIQALIDAKGYTPKND